MISGVPTTLADRVQYTLTGKSFDGEISTTIYLTVLPGWEVTSSMDVADDNMGDGVCKTADAGRCTLRAAFENLDISSPAIRG